MFVERSTNRSCKNSRLKSVNTATTNETYVILLLHNLETLTPLLRHNNKPTSRVAHAQMERRYDDLERQLKESKRDKDGLMEQIRDFQRQVESQRETVVGRYDKEREIQEKMTERNRLLNEALEENKVCL